MANFMQNRPLVAMLNIQQCPFLKLCHGTLISKFASCKSFFSKENDDGKSIHF